MTLLRENARAPVTLLARKMGMSRSAIRDRLARLERDRVIAGYTVRLTQDLDVPPFRAYVMLSVNPKDSAGVVASLKRMPDVQACYAVTGAFDLVAVIATPTSAAMDDLLDQVGLLTGVRRTVSSVVLATKIDRS